MNLVQCLLWSIILCYVPITETKQAESHKEISMKQQNETKYHVQKHMLQNGMTVLVMEDSSQPKVSIQVFYHVGSKDEKDGEKGIAHLIEHMIFKGTTDAVLHLSESDIDAITQKISGRTNAFTSHDYTGYLFDVPSTQWTDVLPILADCMMNAEFDDQKLNSEMKAVIQELKMYRDSYVRVLLTELLSVLFTNHPYHYPVIGYKEDLWSVSGQDLRNFYKAHYVPNNATLIVVGDVNYEQVVQEAEKAFGNIKPQPDYQKTIYAQEEDIIKKSITLYRDIQQPVCACVFLTPGLSKKQEAGATLAAWVLAEKRHCRLYKKLVHDLQLATSVHASHISFFDHTIFYILYHPQSTDVIPKIEQIIAETLNEIASVGISDDEIRRAIKNYKMELSETMDDFEERANEIGVSFLSTGDPEYGFNILGVKSEETLKEDTVSFIAKYLRPTVMHTGFLLPIPSTEKEHFIQLQQKSDELDTKILAPRVRLSEVEPPRYAENIVPKAPESFIFPKPQEQRLANGLTTLLLNQPSMERVTLALMLKAHGSVYDPDNKPGLYNFMSLVLQEGTAHYNAEHLAEFLEMRGMSLSINPGTITIECLAEDVDNALIILKEIVSQENFQDEAINKVRAQLLTKIKAYWDDPKSFSTLLFNQAIYKDHPWGKNSLGTNQSISEITKQDLIQFYNTVMSPDGATLTIVGAINPGITNKAIEAHLGSWLPRAVKKIEYPVIQKAKSQEIDYYIERDQVVLMMGNLSIDRYHPDYEKLLIFDQYFGGGVLGSMMSYLFQLRQASGLFYGISGSTISDADEQPGKFVVKTIVSRDRLDEAITAIKDAIDSAIEEITEEDIEDAKRAILYSQVELCNTSNSIAAMFLTLHRLQLPYTYYETRYKRFSSITKEDVVTAVKQHLNSSSLVVLKVGRI